MSERVLVWMDSTILKEQRTRKERGATVFEYRLNGGEWKETHRILWGDDGYGRGTEMTHYEITRRMALTYAIIMTAGPALALFVFCLGMFLK